MINSELIKTKYNQFLQKPCTYKRKQLQASQTILVALTNSKITVK